jgi:hypothetical protein
MTAYIDPTVTSQPADTLTQALKLNLNLRTVSVATEEPSAPAPKLEQPYSFKVATNGSLIAGFALIASLLVQAALPVFAAPAACNQRGDKRVEYSQNFTLCLTKTAKAEPRVDIYNAITGSLEASIVNMGRSTAIMRGQAIRVTGSRANANTIYGSPSDVNVIANVSGLTGPVLDYGPAKLHLYGTK